MPDEATEFRAKLDAVVAEAPVTDTAESDGGGEENTEVSQLDEAIEGQEEALDDAGEGDDVAATFDDDEEVDATPRVSLKKHQKTEERARKAEREAFEANARLQAFMEAQKLAAPIAERPQEVVQNPYDRDMEPERFELWETKQKADALEKRLENFEKGQQKTEQQQKHTQAVGLLAQTTGTALLEAQKSGKIPDAVAAYQFLAEKVGEMGLDVDNYMMSRALVPIQEGRIHDLAPMYKSLAVSLGYKHGKKAGSGANLDAVERNRGKSAGVTKSANASPTGSIDITQAVRKGGRGVDPDAFRKTLENASRI